MVVGNQNNVNLLLLKSHDLGYIVRSPALPYSVSMDDLDQRLREACRPEFDTACHAEAVRQWNVEQSYNGERLNYLDMTLDQRMWVNRRAQDLKAKA